MPVFLADNSLAINNYSPLEYLCVCVSTQLKSTRRMRVKRKFHFTFRMRKYGCMIASTIRGV